MSKDIDRLINQAFDEDMNKLGDITTLALFDGIETGKGSFMCEADGVLSGLGVTTRCFELYDKSVVVTPIIGDGDILKAGDIIATAKGSMRSLLAVERTALNFLAHLSGVATLTKSFVDETEGTKTIIKDTRKTLPGFRKLEKQAVVHGKGQNHRKGLYDGILIKDNHLEHVSIAQAVQNTRNMYPNYEVEVEVETLSQVKEALDVGADVLLLDNMNEEELEKALKIIDSKAKTEVSGGIKLMNVRKIARLGVDFISTSALTMAAPPLDITFAID